MQKVCLHIKTAVVRKSKGSFAATANLTFNSQAAKAMRLCPPGARPVDKT